MYLEDMCTAMTRIAEYINDLTFLEFKQDYKTVDAVIRKHLKNYLTNLRKNILTFHGLKCTY